MDKLRLAFVDAVNSELFRQMAENGDDVPFSEHVLEANIQGCLEMMAELERNGERFDHQIYSNCVREAIRESPDGDAVMKLFREYCHFQSMVLVFSAFSNLQKRFRLAGLGSWTKLQVDKRTLLPFAFNLVGRLDQAIAKGGVLPPGTEEETVELIYQTVNLFDIPISTGLQARLNFYLNVASEAPDEEGAMEGKSNRVISRPRTLN
jgi:hypothetical protein